jgi:uncharacterized protein (DUF1800 family)
MRRRAHWEAVLLLAFALPAAALAAGSRLGPDNARHLLNRTGFDARPAEIGAFASLSRNQAADRILASTTTAAGKPAPVWSNQYISPRVVQAFSDSERKQFQRELVERGIELKNWWVTEMLTTPSPLTERMTLFWHNHFPSSLQKVRSATLLYHQNVLLRRHALGNFAELLRAVSKDPAMLVYLDSATNRRGQPNENFAREVMELFTLGEGGYTEQDVREAARAFTGWSIDRETGEFMWRAFAHDTGVKTVLGRTGLLDGNDVLGILLASPRTAEFVVTKLWKEFVSPDPDAREVARIAALFRESGYDIRTALRAILVSDAFYAAEHRGVLVKSPVDLVIGTMRQFEVGFSDPLPLTLLLRTLGQDVFSPPNVKGWPGGEAWINSTTLLARRQFLERLFRVEESRMQEQAPDEGMKALARLGGGRARFARAALDIRFSGSGWLRQFGKEGTTASLDAELHRVLLALPEASGNSDRVEGVDLIRSLTADPAYQLK